VVDLAAGEFDAGACVIEASLMGHQARIPQLEATALFLTNTPAILMRVPLPLATLRCVRSTEARRLALNLRPFARLGGRACG
jgi:hypothetical protein